MPRPLRVRGEATSKLPAQNPGLHAPLPASTGPTKWPAPGPLQRPSPVPPAERPHPPDLRGRRQPSYLQLKRASAPLKAAASWSRAVRRRRGSGHLAGGGPRALAREPERAERGRFRRAQAAAGLGVQAWLELRGAGGRWASVCSLRPSARPPEPQRLAQAGQPRTALSRD